tara:strand:- start:12432 stop:13583 length:1152 start_codon:yes stop_codon:yes gene_type:complete
MFTFTSYSNIGLINEHDWNNCAGDENPFLSYKFLKNLEDSNSIGIKTSWIPNYICISKNNNILAYIPLFIKLDSQGEYVFDHAWANAYYNSGGKYYPKIQSSIPYTPVTGNRILINKKIKNELILTIISEAGKYIENFVDKNNISSAHITFCTYKEHSILSRLNFLKRIGEQYHWQNKKYKSFENFLESLNSRKRKAINKERKYISKSKIKITIKTGKELSKNDLKKMFIFYNDTALKKWGRPYLNETFFILLNKNFSDKILLIFAEKSTKIIAGAMHIIGKNTLYGRYWGCTSEVKYLHFELCYYQAIEWAIKNNKKYVEGGAQGPHKIQRGYLPVKTYSAHYISNKNFRNAVKQFLNEEKHIILNDINLINNKYTPYKNKD